MYSSIITLARAAVILIIKEKEVKDMNKSIYPLFGVYTTPQGQSRSQYYSPKGNDKEISIKWLPEKYKTHFCLPDTNVSPNPTPPLSAKQK